MDEANDESCSAGAASGYRFFPPPPPFSGLEEESEMLGFDVNPGIYDTELLNLNENFDRLDTGKAR